MNKIVKPIIVSTEEGRSYKLGAQENTEVIFKADGAEVDNKYAITEWWLEKDAPGPDPHVHESQDELIYVLEGPVEVLIGHDWTALEKGGLVIIPASTQHTFRNTSDNKVGILNIFLNGAYEAFMPQIMKMYAER